MCGEEWLDMAGCGWISGAQMVNNLVCLAKKLACFWGVYVCLISDHMLVAGCYAIGKACVCGTSTVPFSLPF